VLNSKLGLAAVAACLVAASLISPNHAGAVTTTACTILPRDNVWHSAVTALPVHKRSATYVRSIGASSHLHPDFGSGLIGGEPFGIPITVVTRSAPAVRISFQYASESDRGPYRIPANALVEGGRIQSVIATAAR
jgi:hypothetical protein